MCNTVIATGEATADGTIILAGNSHRAPNEPQVLTYVPRTRHEAGSTLKCARIEIPQVAETCEVLLSRPFRVWGCEAGANEHGVAVANQAGSRTPHTKHPGLTGMDLARLALERAGTARTALDAIVELLGTCGQGSDDASRKRLYHHNSFVIADPNEAWVLETAGRFWAAERVRGVRIISNGLNIGSAWDLASPGLVENAIEKGWCQSRDDFHFAHCYANVSYTRLGRREARQQHLAERLKAHEGRITVETMMSILRDHGPKAAADRRWNPGKGLSIDALCAHAGLFSIRSGQATASLVAHLARDLPTYWVTGTSAPCTSIFKPVYLGGAGLPNLGCEPADLYDPESLWWTHERLHRTAIRDYVTRMPMFQEERDAQEAQFLSEAAEMYEKHRRASAEERAAPLAKFTASCFKRAATATAAWTAVVSAAPMRHRTSPLFSMTWNTFNWQAKFAPKRSRR